MARTLHRAEPVHRQRFRYSRYQSGFNHRTWQLHRRWRQQRTWRRFEKRSLEWLAIPTKVENQNAGCIHVQCDYASSKAAKAIDGDKRIAASNKVAPPANLSELAYLLDMLREHPRLRASLQKVIKEGQDLGAYNPFSPS